MTKPASRPSPEEIRRRVLAKAREFIGKNGFGVFWVADQPTYAYTVGLTHSFDHPEVVIFGLGSDDAQGILNALGARLKAGERFAPGQPIDKLMESFPALLLPIPPEACHRYLRIADAFYDREAFEALQLVWPDPDGRFFHEDGYDRAFDALQPIVGRWPIA